MKKKCKKLKEDATETKKPKTTKNSEPYNFPRRTTTLPFKNLTLVTIFSKKSPQMPPNPLQGGLVY